MRIGINAQILTDGRTGVTRFAQNIIQSFPRIGVQHTFVIFGNSPLLSFEERNVELVRTASCINSSSKRILWEQLILPRLARKHNLDCMFYPDHTSSLFQEHVPQSIMLHDLAPYAMPDTFSAARRIYKQFAIARSVRNAQIIFSDSQSTRTEALKYFPGIGNKIHVVPLGLEHTIARVEDESVLAAIRKRYSLREPFLLFIGTLEARKNVLRLIRAFAEGRRLYGWKHSLVLAGAPGHGYDGIAQLIRQEGIQEHVIVTGYIDNSDLSSFYSLADIFIYPSLYEGFGFPPLEAMKCGCPVVVSNTTSLPEVVGDAGVYINPYDEQSIRTGIHSLVGDASLKNKFIQSGRARSMQFTWEKTVQTMIEILERIR